MFDNMTAQERETIQTIEKGLVDIKKGLATKDELIKEIDTRRQSDAEAATKAVTEVRSEVEEIKALGDQLQTQLRRLHASGLKDAERGRYHGNFSSAAEAKLFGLQLLAGSMAGLCGRSDIAAKHARILKSIEKMGIEVTYVHETSGERLEKAATTGSQAAGSLLVTSEIISSPILMLEEYGVVASEFGPVPMGAGVTLTPKLDTLLTVYVPGEGTAPSVSDPTIGAINLIAKALTALCAYSKELDEDSAIAMAELYGPLIMRSIAYYMDLCGLLGDGTDTFFGFRGIVGALRAVDATIGNIKSLVVGTGNAYSELVYGDFENVVGTLPQFADGPFTKWLMHRYFYYTVFVRAALAAGTGAKEVITGESQKQRLACGYPVKFAQEMPKAEANSQICATLGDYKLGCQLGTRGALEIMQSDQRYFDQGLIALRAVLRAAINAHGVGNTTNAGAIVGLITAGS
jgi:HK97 family phage major capsid protein